MPNIKAFIASKKLLMTKNSNSKISRQNTHKYSCPCTIQTTHSATVCMYAIADWPILCKLN